MAKRSSIKLTFLLAFLLACFGCDRVPNKQISHTNIGTVVDYRCSGSLSTSPGLRNKNVCIATTDLGYRVAFAAEYSIKLGTGIDIRWYNDGKCWMSNEGITYSCGFSDTYAEK